MEKRFKQGAMEFAVLTDRDVQRSSVSVCKSHKLLFTKNMSVSHSLTVIKTFLFLCKQY